MENLLLLLATSFAMRFSSPRKFKSQFIGNTGCSALTLSGEEFEKTRSTSGDQLYFHQFREKNVSYGLICVQFQEDYDLHIATEMLSNYMEKLRGPFYVLHNVGQQQDADWNNTDSRTLVDYWQDSEKKDWKVKGYTNGRCMAILYVKNISQVEVSKQDLFLDSFHFNYGLISR